MALKALVIIGVLMGALAAAAPAVAADRPSVSGTLDAMLAEARRFEADGRDDHAALLYQRAHHTYPFAVTPLLGWGALANRIGAFYEAITILKAALAIGGGDRDVRRNLGLALIGLDRGQEALQIFDKLLAEDPTQAADWNGKGLALDLMERHPDAQLAYRNGLGVAPGHAVLQRNLELSLAAADAPPFDGTAAGVTVAFNAGGPASAVGPMSTRRSRSAGPDP